MISTATEENSSSLLEDEILEIEQRNIYTESPNTMPNSEVHIKKENLNEIPKHPPYKLEDPETLSGNIKPLPIAETSSRCLINSVTGLEKPVLDLQNNNVTDHKENNPIEHEHNLDVSSNKPIPGVGNGDDIKPTIFSISGVNLNQIKLSCANIGFNLEPKDCLSKTNNLSTCESENEVNSLKSEIELSETKVGFGTEGNCKQENFIETPQLQIVLEKLSIANETHKKGMVNLRKPHIELRKVDSRVMRKVKKFGFIKITSDFLKPMLQQNPKKVYPKGHYFSRGKNVTYEKDEFDLKFFQNALRRGANIDDKGKFLKYQCPTCPYKTWSFYALSRHHKGLHGVRINWTFTCPDCSFTTNQECTMNRHQQRHKKEPDLPCPHCPYITRFDVALRVHLRRWHLSDEEAKTLNCQYCNFVSVCKTTYDAHVMVHLKDGENRLARFLQNSANNNEAEIIKCEYCKFKTPNKNGLRRHLQETHKIKDAFEKQLYRCKYCGFETKHRFSFRNHLLLHENVEADSFLECHNCGFKTKWKKYLTLHMRMEHSRPELQKEKTYYHCAECDKKFPTKFPLKNHIFLKHREAEVLMCHDCNYTTKTMAVLKRHALIKHINPVKKIFKCQKCSHISKDKAKHKAHLKTHKFECYKCGVKTGTKGALRYHIVGHMSKKKQKKVLEMYKCQCCDYESRNKHHYERHMKRWGHHPDKSLENKIKVNQSNEALKNNVEIRQLDEMLDQSLEDNFEVEDINMSVDKASEMKI